jgi:hypothetical protein
MICSQCNKEFVKASNRQIYCSKKCSRKLDSYKEQNEKYEQSEKGIETRKNYAQKIKKTIQKNTICPQCNKRFIPTYYNQKGCSQECIKKGKAEVRKKYLKTDKAKALKRKYKQSDKGKEAENKYQQSDLGKSTIKKYRQSDEFKEAQKKHMRTDKAIAARKRYQKTEKYRNNINKNARERRKTDPIYSLVNNVRARLGNFLRVRNMIKTNRTFKMVGCTPEFLKKHLEKQFYPHPTTNEKMTWKNHSKYGWHVDHKLPMDLAMTSEDVEELSHYTNLQPMWATENLKKSNKII